MGCGWYHGWKVKNRALSSPLSSGCFQIPDVSTYPGIEDGTRDGSQTNVLHRVFFLTPGNNAPHPQADRCVVATTGPRQSPQAMTTGMDTSENVCLGKLPHSASHTANSLSPLA